MPQTNRTIPLCSVKHFGNTRIQWGLILLVLTHDPNHRKHLLFQFRKYMHIYTCTQYLRMQLQQFPVSCRGSSDIMCALLVTAGLWSSRVCEKTKSILHIVVKHAWKKKLLNMCALFFKGFFPRSMRLSFCLKLLPEEHSWKWGPLFVRLQRFNRHNQAVSEGIAVKCELPA